MGTEVDLEALAKLAVSARRVLIGAALAMSIAFAGALVMGSMPVEELRPYKSQIAFALFGIAGVAFVLAMRVRTPPEKFPTIRVLRDRANTVAHIVAISRGNPFLALTDRDGALLAKPLRLAGSAALPTRNANIAIQARDEATQLERAIAIAQARCPTADLRAIVDNTGLTSMAKLAQKAVRGETPLSLI